MRRAKNTPTLKKKREKRKKEKPATDTATAEKKNTPNRHRLGISLLPAFYPAISAVIFQIILIFFFFFLRYTVSVSPLTCISNAFYFIFLFPLRNRSEPFSVQLTA